jgi:hypothetical protein
MQSDELLDELHPSFVRGHGRSNPGASSSQWTADTLHGVEQWATKCLSQTPRSSGGNWGTWEMFRRVAAIGMDMRKEMDRKNEANGNSGAR